MAKKRVGRQNSDLFGSVTMRQVTPGNLDEILDIMFAGSDDPSFFVSAPCGYPGCEKLVDLVKTDLCPGCDRAFCVPHMDVRLHACLSMKEVSFGRC